MDQQEQKTAAQSGMAVRKAGSDDSDRRIFKRYVVDCPASLGFLAGAAHMKCHLVDLSLSGCRLVPEKRFQPGVHVRVEVQFALRGIGFRACGVTMGSRGSLGFAVRFLEMPKRRLEELAEVLAEEELAHPVAGAGSRETTPAAYPLSKSPSTVSQTADGLAGLRLAAERDSGMGVECGAARDPEKSRSAEKVADVSQINRAGAEKPGNAGFTRKATGLCASADPRESNPTSLLIESPSIESPSIESPSIEKRTRDRRKHSRLLVETKVKLLLVKAGISMPGRIVNLSEGGCRLQTEEHFNMGIYVRVETEFYLYGLPFRLAGVSQTILDRNTIGIRFLDMSSRNRQQLIELIAEIAEAERAASAEVERK